MLTKRDRSLWFQANGEETLETTSALTSYVWYCVQISFPMLLTSYIMEISAPGLKFSTVYGISKKKKKKRSDDTLKSHLSLQDLSAEGSLMTSGLTEWEATHIRYHSNAHGYKWIKMQVII